jgi:hypothetical protein
MLEEISTLLGATAAVVSVSIAAKVYYDSRKEAPDIKYDAKPLLLTEPDMRLEAITTQPILLFHNYGEKAGSLREVQVVENVEAEYQYMRLTPDVRALPTIIQPYTSFPLRTELVIDAHMRIREFLEDLEGRAKFYFTYETTTRKGTRQDMGCLEVVALEQPATGFVWKKKEKY